MPRRAAAAIAARPAAHRRATGRCPRRRPRSRPPARRGRRARRITASAVGERQMLPEQTNSRRVGIRPSCRCGGRLQRRHHGRARATADLLGRLRAGTARSWSTSPTYCPDHSSCSAWAARPGRRSGRPRAGPPRGTTRRRRAAVAGPAASRRRRRSGGRASRTSRRPRSARRCSARGRPAPACVVHGAVVGRRPAVQAPLDRRSRPAAPAPPRWPARRRSRSGTCFAPRSARYCRSASSSRCAGRRSPRPPPRAASTRRR